jgi:hypothetical protein
MTFSIVKALRPLPKAIKKKEKYPMTTGIETQEDENRLLSQEERDILGEVATKDPPFSQRAQALLAIDEGTTQAAAGQQAGLTKGQVRYWLTKFRKVRIAIIPEELLDQVQQGDPVSSQIAAEQAASPDVTDLEQPEDEEDAPVELLDPEETAGPVDSAPVEQEYVPKGKKVKSKKAKKSAKTKKDKKASKGKKPKKTKKASKGKKPKKKTKKASKGKKPKKKTKKASKGKQTGKKKKKDKAQKSKRKKGKSGN